MCGFIGMVSDQAMNDSNNTTALKGMTDAIFHRGPDQEGFHSDEHVMFGFRRLSIIDLENGNQPLSFENERYWIIFNGEIYNYIEIRERLLAKGVTFETHSDTEVLLALYSVNKEAMVGELRGMFGFVIYDKHEKTIFAARDRFGIKPFFYYEDGERLYLASEKKSIMLAKAEEKVNEEALQHYLTFQFPPEPMTMSEGVFKLEPGHYIMKKIGKPMVIKQYWKPSFTASTKSLDVAKIEIETAMRDSVKIHMRSDVPVGSFLSGGIDSTAVVALAKEENPNIKTFTVGFEREGYSEVDVAKESAAKLGVENIAYTIQPDEFINEFPKIIWHMDDPMADPAAVPLYFLAREASKHVKVVLSGEGADELFGGYNIYREPLSLKGFSYLPAKGKDVLRLLAERFPDGVKGKSFVERGCTPLENRFIGNAKIFTEFEKSLLLKRYNHDLPYTKITHPLYDEVKEYDEISKMQYIDMHTWLRGDILVKADKMTMAHSLELRVPFLDKEVFEVASKLDSSLKVTSSTTKFALREAMKNVVPDHVINRRKLGFPVPIRVWLKDHLYDWAKDLINDGGTDEFFHKDYLLKLLEDHRQGKGDQSRRLWTALTFIVWHQIYVEGRYGNEFADKVQAARIVK